MKGLDRYRGFGIRKQWLVDYLKNPQDWWTSDVLGKDQFKAMRVWLREGGLIENHQLIPLGERIRRLGADHLLTWAVIWTNLAYNSALVQWYVHHIPWRAIQTKQELIELLPSDLSRRTRENAVKALVGLFRHTPLGEEMELGRVKMKGGTVDTVTKRGWAGLHPLALLYSLYRLAENVGRHSFTIREFYEERLEGPFLLFGTGRDQLTRQLQGLSLTWPDWIRVEVIFDLDNVYLNERRKSYEVLDLALAGS